MDLNRFIYKDENIMERGNITITENRVIINHVRDKKKQILKQGKTLFGQCSESGFQKIR